MKNKLQNTFISLKDYYHNHPKRFWVIGIVLVIFVVYLFNNKTSTNLTVVQATRVDLKQTVLATGQVTAATDLSLSFSSNGLVATLPVSVGDKVKKGQVVATLRNNNEYAALKLAQANYQKVADGASNEEVAVAKAALSSAQTSLSNIQKTQDTLVESSRRAVLNVGLVPTLSSGTTGTPPTISGVYTAEVEGSYVINPRVVNTNSYFTYSGVESGTGIISTTAPMPLGTKGLFIQFSSDYSSNANNVWTVMLPNTVASGYLTAYNAYQNSLKTRDSATAAAQAAVNEAQANLDYKKAVARPADLAAVQAAIDQAQATYENTILRAPEDGTIVHVDTKIGERADAQKEVIVLQDISNLHVEANINETNIAKVLLGQPVEMTLDAFGPGTTFTGSVIQIDPSSTTNDGVVNYKIKVSINSGSPTEATQNIPLKEIVRPGMNANMTIIAWNHKDVVSIPKAALDQRTNGTFVKVVTDAKNNKFIERQITTGLLGDGNLIEVIDGLSGGESVVISE